MPMRCLVATLGTLIGGAALAGCATTAAPAAAPAVGPAPVEVTPPEEPPPPAPAPVPRDARGPLSERIAAALDAQAEKNNPSSGSQGLHGLGGLLGASGGQTSSKTTTPDPDVIVTYKIVSSQGKFVTGGLPFALDMHQYELASCLANPALTEKKGSVTATLKFDKDGAPEEPAVSKSTFKDKSITDCVRIALGTVDPASHSANGPDVQANQRATVQVDLERPDGF